MDMTGKLMQATQTVSSGSGSLQKLTIQYEEEQLGIFSGKIQALFNPNKLSYARNVQWAQKKSGDKGAASAYLRQEFINSEPETLTVDLFFDTYAPPSNQLALGHQSARMSLSPQATSVKPYTDQLSKLALINQELHRPPVCQLMWGKLAVFRGVLTSLNYTFTLFLANGTPVRAIVTCSFAQSLTEAYAARALELHSADIVKTHLVQRGDTLQSIAAKRYGDPTLWRPIAQANKDKIDNPRLLKPGILLKIPKLQP